MSPLGRFVVRVLMMEVAPYQVSLEMSRRRRPIAWRFPRGSASDPRINTPNSNFAAACVCAPHGGQPHVAAL